jgi:hypothetical protein
MILIEIDPQRKQTTKLKRNSSMHSKKDSDLFVNSDYDETGSLSSRSKRTIEEENDSLLNLSHIHHPNEYVKIKICFLLR